MPLRPCASSFQSLSYQNNQQQNQSSPFFASQFRKSCNNTQIQQPSVVAFQNNAFMVDEDSTTSETIQKQRQPILGTQNNRLPMVNNNGIVNNNNRHPPSIEELEQQPRFGASSRVSRV